MLTHHRLTSIDLLSVLKALSGGGESLFTFLNFLLNNYHIYVYIDYTYLGIIMKASIVDLRYKMKEILQALENREIVSILYHGKVKGTIVPSEGNGDISVSDHPFFSMNSNEESSVVDSMKKLRGSRYNDL